MVFFFFVVVNIISHILIFLRWLTRCKQQAREGTKKKKSQDDVPLSLVLLSLVTAIFGVHSWSIRFILSSGAIATPPPLLLLGLHMPTYYLRFTRSSEEQKNEAP